MYFAASASMLSSFWIEYKRGFQFWRSPAGLNSVSRMYCVVDVHAGENGKHVGLQEGYEEFECGNRDRHDERQDSAADTDGPKGRQRNDEARKDLERDVTGKHVREKTNRKADRTRQERDDFNGDDQRHDDARNAARHEQLEKAEAMLEETIDNDRGDDQDGKRERHDDLAGDSV